MEFIEVKDFYQIYKDMQVQFPPEELKPYEHLKSIVSESYKIYQVIENIPVGYIILFQTEEFIFIDYIAIYQEFHSKGFGGKILDSLKQHFNKKGCFLEVEKPDPENINTLRRIKFYEKNGAKKLNINYIYPNYHGGLPMDLYYISFNKQKTTLIETKNFITSLFACIHSDIKNYQKFLDKIFG